MVNGTNVLRLLNGAAAIQGTGATALTAGAWYRVEVSIDVPAAGNSVVELRVDGTTQVSGSFALGNTAPAQFRFGVTGGNLGGLAAVYHDDVAINDETGTDQNSWCGEGSVYALLGAADPNTGTAQANWTKPGGATTNRHTSVGKPLVYQADSTLIADAEKFVRNPTNALSQLEIDVADYTAAGVPAGEAVKLVQPVAGTGSTSATDTAGVIECLSNPAVASKAMTTYDNGIASATVTTWPRADGNVTYNPTVTRGTRPRVRLTKNAVNRVVMCNMLALLVETARVPLAPPPVADAFGLTDAERFARTEALADGLALTDLAAPVKAGGPFEDPSDLTGLALWYDADSLALSDGASVTTWADLSGAGRTLTTAAAPTFQTNELNGLPGVLFDGSDDYLTHLAGAAWITGDTVTVFAVMRQVAPVSNGRMMAFNATDDIDYSTPSWCIYDGGAGDRIAPYSNGELAIQVPHPTGATLMTTWFDGTDHNLRVDGAPASTPTLSMAQMEPFTAFGTTRFTLGSGWLGGPSSGGNYMFHEVVVYDRALTGAERDQVEAYLTEKWLSGPAGTGQRGASPTASNSPTRARPPAP